MGLNFEDLFTLQLAAIASITIVGYFLLVTNRLWLNSGKLIITFFWRFAKPHYNLTDSLYESVPGLKEQLIGDCIIEDNVLGYSFWFKTPLEFFYAPELQRMKEAFIEKAVQAWNEKYQVSIDIEPNDTTRAQLEDDRVKKQIKFKDTLQFVSNYDDILTIVNLMGFYVVKTRSSYVVFKNFNVYKYDDYCYDYLSELVKKSTEYGRMVPTWQSVISKGPKLVLVNTADRTCWSAVFESINTKYLNFANLKLSLKVIEDYQKKDNSENRKILRFEGNHKMELELLLFCVDFLYDRKNSNEECCNCWTSFTGKLECLRNEIYFRSSQQLNQLTNVLPNVSSVVSIRSEEKSDVIDNPLTIDSISRDVSTNLPSISQQIMGNEVDIAAATTKPSGHQEEDTAVAAAAADSLQQEVLVNKLGEVDCTLNRILNVIQEQFVPRSIDHSNDLKYNLCDTTHSLSSEGFVQLEIDSIQCFDDLKLIRHPVYVNHIEERWEKCKKTDEEKDELFKVYAYVYTLSKRKEEMQLFRTLWFVGGSIESGLHEYVQKQILQIVPYRSNPTIIVNCGKTTTFFDFGGLFEMDFITDKHCFLKALICFGLSKRVIFESMFNTFGVNKTTNILMKGTIWVSDFILLLNTVRNNHITNLTVFIAVECLNNIAYREKMVIQGKMIGMGEIQKVLLIRNGNNLDVYEYDSNFTYRNVDYLPEILLD